MEDVQMVRLQAPALHGLELVAVAELRLLPEQVAPLGPVFQQEDILVSVVQVVMAVYGKLHQAAAAAAVILAAAAAVTTVAVQVLTVEPEVEADQVWFLRELVVPRALTPVTDL